MDNLEHAEITSEEKKHLFLFELDGDLYAVPVEFVDRVIKIPPITPVPNAPRAIIGIFHLRGSVVLALDLASRMGIPRLKPLSQNFLFVVRYKKDQFAILIDKPKVIVHVPVLDIHSSDSILTARVPQQYVRGTFMYEEVLREPTKKRTIIIEYKDADKKEPEKTMASLRPVLLLDLERLLDQEDLQRMFTSQE